MDAQTYDRSLVLIQRKAGEKVGLTKRGGGEMRGKKRTYFLGPSRRVQSFSSERKIHNPLYPVAPREEDSPGRRKKKIYRN